MKNLKSYKELTKITGFTPPRKGDNRFYKTISSANELLRKRLGNISVKYPNGLEWDEYENEFYLELTIDLDPLTFCENTPDGRFIVEKTVADSSALAVVEKAIAYYEEIREFAARAANCENARTRILAYS